MRSSTWQTLCRLAELGAIQGNISISTTTLARSLDISQQTASRHLIDLERQGFITRQQSSNGEEIKITENGVKELRLIYVALKTIFDKPKPRTLILTGRVFTGLGEGAYYVDKTDYGGYFQKWLGFKPYPGTLNLRLLPSQVARKKELEAYSGILIKGFERGGRSFGGVKCFHATANGVEGAVIQIGRTHYDESVIELIAPTHLRQGLKLKDGSKVKVIIQVEGKREDKAS
jgi:riboflavin kinase